MKRSYLFSIALVICFVTACFHSSEHTAYLKKDTAFVQQNQRDNKKLIRQYYNENVLLYENTDDTYELTMFSSPVYIEENNSYNLCDNTLDILEEDEAVYTNHRNDIKVRLPQRLSDIRGMELSDGKRKLVVTPVTAESGKTKKSTYTDIYGEASERLRYSSIFGQNTYTVQADDFGVNTELEIKDDTSTLEYWLDIENVTVDQSCPDYILFRRVKDQEPAAVVYKPVVKRQDESLIDSMTGEDACGMRITEEGLNRYRLTIVLPGRLTENRDAYPLKLNQSFHMYKPKQADSAIYSLSDEGYFLQDKVVLGYSEKGESELNIRFEALSLLDIPAEDILSATYTINEISGSTETATIMLYPILGEWCSINTRWYNKPQKTEEYAQTLEISQSGAYSFDITEPLRLWMKNQELETGYIIRHGFALVNTTPDAPKVFATADNGIFTTCLTIQLKRWEDSK